MPDTVSDTETVLFANDAFYAAFSGRDWQAMAQVWSDREPVTCLHPGWPPLAGRDEVLESWRSILTAEGAPEVQWRAPQAFVTGDVARVICFEVIGDTALVATNLFVREGAAWRLVHHQSGPSPEAPPPDAEPLAM
jgi:ketosteroid isomerase-like protein